MRIAEGVFQGTTERTTQKISKRNFGEIAGRISKGLRLTE